MKAVKCKIQKRKHSKAMQKIEIGFVLTFIGYVTIFAIHLF